MNKLQKFGGWAALYEAAAYVVGIVGFLLVVNLSEISDPVEQVAAIGENIGALSTLYLFVYVIFGAALVVLTLAVDERLQGKVSPLARTATVFGLIWSVLVIASGMIFNIGMETAVSTYATNPAEAATIWKSINAIAVGLGGGIEVVGGIWVTLLSVAGLRNGRLPRWFSRFGFIVGGAGLITIIPALGEIGGIVFGLSQIIWFVWLGVALLRGAKETAVVEQMTPAFE